MALTSSNRLDRDTLAPNFKLPNVIDGKPTTLAEIQGNNGIVVLFICNHCPYVIHVNPLLVALANKYQAKGIGFVAISSNDVENYPQDAPDLMKIHAIENNYPFPYLYDATQEVAKAYDAACTPDVFVFDAELKLYYHGQLDGSRPNNQQPVTGEDIQEALDLLLSGATYTKTEKPCMGCGIKWKL